MKNFKNYFPLFFPLLILMACGKKNNSTPCNIVTGSPSASEISDIEAYLTAKGITATRDPRGFFYNMPGPGYGTDYPNINSTVTVRYKGELTNGQVFDSTAGANTVSFPLRNLILGWQYGIPLARKGGVINLYLPPSLGYGCSATGSIPGSSILIFRIEVVNF